MVSHRVVLRFPHKLVDKPIVCNLTKDYALEFNILKAYITPDEEGLLVLELKGNEQNYQRGIDYLSGIGVKVAPLSLDVVQDRNKCTDCSVCVAICPSNALAVDASTRKVDFYDDKCIACGLCVTVCPYNAMNVEF